RAAGFPAAGRRDLGRQSVPPLLRPPERSPSGPRAGGDPPPGGDRVLSRDHFTDYDDAATARCERVLVTLLGDLGPWRERIYLAGGLAPRYLVGQLPEGARAHVGTTDIDLVIGLALGDETPETYRTLQNNLQKAGFEQKQPSFRWSRDVEGFPVIVAFLCETDQVPPGNIFKPTQEGETTGSKLGAFNVRGAH